MVEPGDCVAMSGGAQDCVALRARAPHEGEGGRAPRCGREGDTGSAGHRRDGAEAEGLSERCREPADCGIPSGWTAGKPAEPGSEALGKARLPGRLMAATAGAAADTSGGLETLWGADRQPEPAAGEDRPPGDGTLATAPCGHVPGDGALTIAPCGHVPGDGAPAMTRMAWSFIAVWCHAGAVRSIARPSAKLGRGASGIAWAQRTGFGIASGSWISEGGAGRVGDEKLRDRDRALATVCFSSS